MDQSHDYKEVLEERPTHGFIGNVMDVGGWEGKRLQGLEDAVWQMLGNFCLDNTTGVQLDKLGTLLGEIRRGRDDETYRAVLQTLAHVKGSSITNDSILNYSINVLEGNVIFYEEVYPAGMYIGVTSMLYPELARSIKGLIGAGIQLSLIGGSTEHMLLLAGHDIQDAGYDTYISQTGYFAEYNHTIDLPEGLVQEHIL